MGLQRKHPVAAKRWAGSRPVSVETVEAVFTAMPLEHA
jgi:hypothetical protein